MSTQTVAQTIVDTLDAVGVKRIYGIVGDSLNGLTDAVRRKGTIQWIGVRHEEAAAFAAGAEAQLTGELAVCAGSCGPGNLHLINGLFDCHRSAAPVLAIAAHIPTAEIGTGYFQETHPQTLFAECSHYAELLSTPQSASRLLDRAIGEALGKRGVAMLVMPGDMQGQEVEAPTATRWLKPAPALVRPRDAELAQLVALLNGVEKVTVLAGAGCAGAHAEVIALCGLLKAPLVHALRGKQHIEWENPYDVGMTGLIGFSSGYHAMKECELLLMLGTDFPYRQFYPTDAKITQIDIRPEKLGRRSRLDLGVVGDIKTTLEALLPRLQAKTDTRHLERMQADYRVARRELDERAVPGRGPIHPQYLARLISDLAAADAVISCDVGTPTVWAARYLKMNGKRRLLGSFVHGSMANAMPQALGAQASFPGRQVISMSGDGGFSMLMGDFITLEQARLPVKVVIFDNCDLAFVDLEMRAAGLLQTGTELENPDFARVAQAAGLFGVRVEDPEALEGALRSAFQHDGPAVVDVRVNREELILPPKITMEQLTRFGLWTAKAVLSGRGDEVLELARTNLRR